MSKNMCWIHLYVTLLVMEAMLDNMSLVRSNSYLTVDVQLQRYKHCFSFQFGHGNFKKGLNMFWVICSVKPDQNMKDDSMIMFEQMNWTNNSAVTPLSGYTASKK